LTEGPDVPSLAGLVAVPTYRGQPATAASDLTGVDADGATLTVRVRGAGHWTLLLFLSADCGGCGGIFDALRRSDEDALVGDEAVVVVARELEDRRSFARLVAPGVPVVFSDAAWAAYGALGPPFFSLVDGRADRVVTEGVAWGARQVVAHVVAARRGTGGPEVPRLVPPDA